MKLTSSKSFVLVGLFLVFAAPGLMAYLFYSHPEWLEKGRTNRGLLISPSIYLDTKVNGPQSKWSLILWSPKNCGKACQLQVDKLARVRLALGRRLYQLDALLLLGQEAQDISIPFKKHLQDEAIKVQKVADYLKGALPFSEQPQVYIKNPEGYLILSYSVGAKPDDIYHDLKHLLKNSQ